MRVASALLALAWTWSSAPALPPAVQVSSGADGRHRVVGLSDAASDLVLPVLPLGSPIQMRHVETVPGSLTVVSAPGGIDSDHDAQREFVIRRNVGDIWTTTLEFYESLGDDTVTSVSTMQISPEAESSYYPGDVGDADQDGLAELTVFGRTVNDFFLRLYESDSPNEHPSHLVWEIGGAVASGFFWQVGAKIVDTDGDGKREVVSAGVFFDGQRRIAIFENDGDNSYHLTYSQAFPSINTEQSMAVGSDLDGDGRDEIFFGGWGPSTGEIYAVESTGDDTYQQIWHTVLALPVNLEFIVGAGDLDGDGHREFLAGGRKSGTPPYSSVLYVFEATGDNAFVPVKTLVLPLGLGYSRANVADVDGDGKQEIVFGTDAGDTLYRNTGDNAWEAIWSSTGAAFSIGTGDHDGDGKDEVIAQKAGSTWIWEIYPQYAADLDDDDVVDAVDNCPQAANPNQGPAVLGQQILAVDDSTFAWPKPAAVVYVRGGLSGVSSYDIDLVQTLPPTASFTDASPPLAGTGFYYLVKPDCAVGSWQSELGAEPGRDLVLP
jgi:hypothetical protein